MKIEITKGYDSYIQKWRGTYKHIDYSIVFHTTPYMQSGQYSDLYPDKGIWNGYITIRKASIPKDFDLLVPKIRKFDKRQFYAYESLDDIFNIGITFFKVHRDIDGSIIGFQVGNDYAHSWNNGTCFEIVEYDMKDGINRFIDRFPKYKVWSYINGHYIMAKNIDAYNAKLKLKK